MKPRDTLTIDLFDMVVVPVARTPKPGALDINMQFRHVLSDEIKKSPKSRHEIAARMSELLGHEVTKHQLDSWTAESRDGWRFCPYVMGSDDECFRQPWLDGYWVATA